MKIFGLIFAILAVVQGQEVDEKVTRAGSGLVLDGQGVLSWTQIDEVVFWTLAYNEETGYLGFGHSPTGGMVGSTVVIGLEDGVSVYDLNAKAASQVVEKENPQDIVSDVSFVRENGKMVLTFVAPTSFISLDEPMVVAYGASNDLQYHGATRQSISDIKALPPVEIELEEEQDIVEEVQEITEDEEEQDFVEEEEQGGENQSIVEPRTGSGLVLDGQGILSWSQIDDVTFWTLAVNADTGYIGFGYSPNSAMVGSTVVIGLDKGVSVYDLNGKVANRVVEVGNPEDFISDVSFVKENGKLVLTFVAPNSFISLDEPMVVAYGASDDLQYHGETRQVITDIKQLPPVQEVVEEELVENENDANATQSPTNAPITEAPTNAPTIAPVTEAPTNAPTNAPITVAPTNAPITEVPKNACNYECPANSSRKPYRYCYDSFDDCQCDYGYKKQGNECVKCPSSNSYYSYYYKYFKGSNYYRKSSLRGYKA